MGRPGGPRTHLAKLCLISAVVAVVVGMLAGTALAAGPVDFDSVTTPSAAGAGSFSAGSGTTGTLSVAGAGNSNSTPTETLTYSFGSAQDLSALQQIEVQFSQTSASDQSASFTALATVTDSQGNSSTGETGFDGSNSAGILAIPYSSPDLFSGSANFSSIKTVAISISAPPQSSASMTIDIVAVGATDEGDYVVGPQQGSSVSQIAIGGNPSPTYGQASTFTVEAEGGGGSVVTSDDDSFTATPSNGSVSGTQTLNSGLGQIQVTFTATGAQSLTVDDNGVESTFDVNVQKASQTVAFPKPAAGTVGRSETLSASAPGGTVTFGIDSADSTPSTACSIASDGTTLDLDHAGICAVTATQSGNADYDSASVTRSFGISPAGQVVTFLQPANGTVGGSELLSASAPGGPVLLSVGGGTTPAGACTFESDDRTLDFVHAGTCAIDAHQAGNGDYSPASASTSVSIGQATQTISFPQPAAASVGGIEQLSASAPGGAVSFAVDTAASTAPNTCSLEGDGVTLEFAHAGNCVIDATQSGSSDYLSASTSQTITVGKGTQPISFPQPAAGSVGGSEPMSAGAPAGRVTFAIDTKDSSSADVCSLEGDGFTVDFAHSGTCVVTATQAGDADYNSVTTSDTIDVGPGSQTVSFAQPAVGTVGGSETLSGSAPGGAVTFAVDTKDSTAADTCSLEGDGVTVDFAHAGNCVITASQAGSADYLPASTSQTITVAKATQTIAFPQPSAGTVGGSEKLSASAPGGTVSFSVDTTDSSPSDACSLEGDGVTVDFAHGGNCVITATQGGDADHLPATTSRTITVGKATQTIAFPQPSAGTVGGSEKIAAAAPGGAVSFAVDTKDSSSADVCSLEGDGVTVDFAHAGSCVITATQAGSSDYLAASSSRTITVGKATPQVVLSVNPSSSATVKSPVTLSATVVGVAGGSTPDGSVTFTSTGGASSCSSVTLSDGNGTCSLGALAAGSYSFTATYTGGSDYVAGSPATVSSFAVSKLPTLGGAVLPASALVYGEPATASDTFTSGGQPVSGGTVQWSTESNALGTAQTLDASGSVISPSLAGLAVGTHTLAAGYSGTNIYQSHSDSFNIVVGKASTATSISVSRSALSAQVGVVRPGAGTPNGSVTFYVGGNQVGTAPVSSSGSATLAHTSSGAENVSATYSGDSSFNASSASSVTHNPKLTAKLSSHSHKTRYGWYSGPVKVSFRCAAGSAAVVGSCPGSVVIAKNGAAQSVTRTIHTADGGVATVAVSPINIDRHAPSIRISKLHAASSAVAPLTSVTCTAHAGISGLAHGCKVTLVHHGSTLSYRAVATSKAGRRTVRTGHVHTLAYFVAGAPVKDGGFTMIAGHTYTVEAYLPGVKSSPPVLYSFAAPHGVTPGPGTATMQSLGNGMWAIRVTITAQMLENPDWTLGVNVDGVLHVIPIHVES